MLNDNPAANSQRLSEIINSSRRTVGLYKIDKEDLIRMRQEQYGGATTEDEERHFAVREYLKCELKISEDDIQKMSIEKIFTPAGQKDDPTYLNVTFKEMSSVLKIFDRTRLMRKESRIKTYIPWQFQDRLRAISAFDFELRQDKKFQTRIKMGLNGLELHKKLRGTNSRWERVNLPEDLPPVDMSERPPVCVSISPPPGRPRLSSKRGRGSSGSDNEQSQPKVAKQNEVCNKEKDHSQLMGKKMSFTERVKQANLVSEGPTSPVKEPRKDQGSFISIQTAGTPNKILDNESSVQSPILSKSKQLKH